VPDIAALGCSPTALAQKLGSSIGTHLLLKGLHKNSASTPVHTHFVRATNRDAAKPTAKACL